MYAAALGPPKRVTVSPYCTGAIRSPFLPVLHASPPTRLQPPLMLDVRTVSPCNQVPPLVALQSLWPKTHRPIPQHAPHRKFRRSMSHTSCTAARKSAPRPCWKATSLFIDLIGHFSYVPSVYLFVLDRTLSIPAFPILP